MVKDKALFLSNYGFLLAIVKLRVLPVDFGYTTNFKSNKFFSKVTIVLILYSLLFLEV